MGTPPSEQKQLATAAAAAVAGHLTIDPAYDRFTFKTAGYWAMCAGRSSMTDRFGAR
ncbi:hypothetical protein M6I34_12015 [Burkholderiaceae bacterium FT117]|uniref:hypothetical protein n=1 Tax=Zeimonas sediminis TaxID=2944268 RepID=UPI002342DB70|nr:hypothetical protein [Zeimonas sediminis]MCM5571233.1 hypothetical protein [Zeimonas sediminis]